MTNPYHDIPLRSARDQMIGLLSRMPVPGPESNKHSFEPQQTIPNLLRDLPILYSSIVTDNKPTEFYILGGQKGADYVLCDEKDVPLKSKDEEIKGQYLPLKIDSTLLFHNLRSSRVLSSEKLKGIQIPDVNDPDGVDEFTKTWKGVVQITTPVITKDQTFHILARRSAPAPIKQLREYLIQAVSVRVGIDKTLEVRFEKQLETDTLSETGDRVSIDFNQPKIRKLPLIVVIPQSQEGVYYQLFETTDGERIQRSTRVRGGSQGTTGDMRIELLGTGDFKEDTSLIVRAYRGNKDSKNSLLAGDLDRKLSVIVRPNAELDLTLDSEEIQFDESAVITVSGIQESVNYQLFSRRVTLLEYLPDGNFKIEDVETIQELIPIGDLKPGKGDSINFETGAQQEDSVFVVQATKKVPENGESLRLKKGIVLRVHPSPHPIATVTESIVSNGEKGMIELTDTQAGVKYQLVLDGVPVNLPAFHVTERAIGIERERREFGMRIGLDFSIGGAGEATLRLPTDPLFNASTFQVIAEKSYTGLKTQLPADLEIKIRINTGLQVQLLKQRDTDGLNAAGDTLTIDYNQPEIQKEPLKVRISEPEKEVYYQLFEETAKSGNERSKVLPSVGGGANIAGNIELESTGEFKEDTFLIVHAFRDAKDKFGNDPLLASELDQKLIVRVRPNPDLPIKLDESIIAFAGKTKIKLEGTQTSVSYQVLTRPLDLLEYEKVGDVWEITNLDIETEMVPMPVTKSGNKTGALTFDTGVHQEDSVFVIQATKKDPENGESLRLNRRLLLLVEPSPKPKVSATKITVTNGEEAFIVLTGTQKGVKYRLRDSKGPVGRYGYHFSERAIGMTVERREFGMRVGTDFKVATKLGDESLILPTGPLEKTTTFKVTAIKSYTGVEKELTKNVKITVKTPTS